MTDNLPPDQKYITDMQYCQAFELKAMADLLIRKKTERWISGFANLIVEKEHTERYKWICPYVKGKKVLDIACGVGTGAYMMAKIGDATQVVGCDLDAEAIRYANIRNCHDRVIFLSADAQQFKYPSKFDVIVSFETIEHLPDVPEFLSRIVELLESDGHFYVSTPISKKPIDTNPENPYHVQEWNYNKFSELIDQYLDIEETFLQMRIENYSSLAFNIKKTVLSRLEKNNVKLIKQKFVGPNKQMTPIKLDDGDQLLFDNDYGIVGYQILKCKKKS